MSKVSRLVNLTLALLDARRSLSWPEIAGSVPGYAERDLGDPALRRMFERDKEELREQGVPLETIGRPGDVDTRYRIRAKDYQLPPVQIDRETGAVLALAARLWGSVATGSPVREALRKLDAGGAGDVLSMSAAGPGLRLQLGQGEQAHAALWQACREGRVVRFDYRTVRREHSEHREVEPWGLVCWRGRWYLVGHDRDRGDRRVFRLSRVVGDVELVGHSGAVHRPVDLDLRAEVSRLSERPATLAARVSVPRGRGAELRRAATGATTAPNGRDVLEIGYGELEAMAGWVRRVPDARALEPPELVAEVRKGLLAVLAAHGGPPCPTP